MIGRIFVIVVLLFAFVGSSLYEDGVSEKDFYNISESTDYDYMNLSETFSNQGNNENNSYIERGVYKYMDATAFLIVEGSSEAMSYGYENPRKPYKFAIYLTILMLFASLLIPVIYLIVFTYFAFESLVLYIIEKTKTKANKGDEKEESIINQ